MKRLLRVSLLLLAVLAPAFSSSSQTKESPGEQDTDTLIIQLQKYLRERDYQSAIDVLELLQKRIQAKIPKPETTTFKPADLKLPVRPSPAILKAGSEVVKIHYGQSLIYVPNAPLFSTSSARAFGEFIVEFKGAKAIENKYAKIDGQTKIVKFSSGDPDIASVDDGESHFEVKKPGRFKIIVSVDDYSTAIEFNAIEVPVKFGMNKDQVIAAMGLPDKVNKRYIPWPDSAIVDGFMYVTGSSSASGTDVEHWFYDKYPDLIISFEERNAEIKTRLWDDETKIKVNAAIGG